MRTWRWHVRHGLIIAAFCLVAAAFFFFLDRCDR